jgi:hypothetical protein
MTSHIVPLVVAAVSRRCGGYLAVSSLTFLKPRFKRFLMPVSARLARAGVVANQVTTVSIVGSLIMGGMLSLFHSHSILFGLPAGLGSGPDGLPDHRRNAGDRLRAEESSRRRPE